MRKRLLPLRQARIRQLSELGDGRSRTAIFWGIARLRLNSLVVRALLTGALLFALVACQSKQGSSDVMASVDGRKIYRSDVEKYYQNQTTGSDEHPTAEQATTVKLGILKELIENEILMHRAEKLGLLATDEEVDRKLTEIKSPYSAEVFAQRLQERKTSVEDFKRDIRRALTADKVLHKEVTSKINVTQDDIAAYYNQHRAEFNLIEAKYHLAHILVTTSAAPQG